MKLGEFIKNFSHNNIVRLWYRNNGGYELVLDNFNDVSMDWEINKGKGKNRHFIDNEVLGLASIHFDKVQYPEAINIVIEKLDNQLFINETLDEKIYNESR